MTRAAQNPSIATLPPLSLYIHVPWCVRKCPYCDFNSHAQKGDIPEQAYLNALMEDVTADIAGVQGRSIETVFIGGGTPSLMSPDFYRQLFERLSAHLQFAPDAEITLEANPGTVEQSRFEGFRAAGINRLSLGVQSFNPVHLQTLGRIHDDQAARNAINAARAAGFDNFNIDLMHGLPNQTVDEAVNDLEQALAFDPPHLSWYQLTLEPNTEFYRKSIPSQPELLGVWRLSGNGRRRARQDHVPGRQRNPALPENPPAGSLSQPYRQPYGWPTGHCRR